MTECRAVDPPKFPGQDRLSKVGIVCAGWTGWFATDNPAGLDQLTETFEPYLSSEKPLGDSGVELLISGRETPAIRVIQGGRAIGLPEIIRSGPEWQSRFALYDGVPSVGAASDVLFIDRPLGEAPALRAVGTELQIVREDLWSFYISLFCLWLLLKERPIVTFHSSVCGLCDHALVLIGPSGSGKSTLSWALHEAGADYYGDELSLFHLPEYHLEVVRRDLCLRPGGIESLDLSHLSFAWHEAKPNDPKCQVSLPQPEWPCPNERVSLFFLDGFSSSPSLRAISGSDASRRLLNGMGYGEPSIVSRLNVAAGLVNRHSCWSLVAGTPRDTAEMLNSYVQIK